MHAHTVEPAEPKVHTSHTGVGAAKPKAKGKKVDLAEFQTSLGATSKGGSMSWADAMDVTESGGAAADCASSA